MKNLKKSFFVILGILGMIILYLLSFYHSRQMNNDVLFAVATLIFISCILSLGYMGKLMKSKPKYTGRRMDHSESAAKQKGKTYNAWRIFTRMLVQSKPYYLYYIGLILVILTLSILSIGITEVFRRMVNSVPAKDLQGIQQLPLVAAALIVGTATMPFVRTALTIALTNKSALSMELLLLGRIMKLPIVEYEKRHASDYIQRMRNSVQSAQNGINRTLVLLGSGIMDVVIMMIYLGILNFQLTLVIAGMSVIVPVMLLPLTNMLRGYYDARQREGVLSDSFILETLQGKEVIKSFASEPSIVRTLGNKISNVLFFRLKALPYEAVMSVNYFAAYLLCLIVVLWYGGSSVMDGDMEIGSLIAFILSFQRIQAPISIMSGLWNNLQESISSANRIYEVIDQATSDNNVNRDEITRIEEIKLTNIQFSVADKVILSGINLRVNGGSRNAIVGPSGSGKSTLIKLLAGIYEPTSGEISINGSPCASISLKHDSTYLTQDPHIFTASIYDNILMGNLHATDDEVIAAAKNASIHSFIERSSSGYDSLLGVNGLFLSGGERQRISIARAFLKNSHLLLLDEPTSALDVNNEASIHKALEILTEHKTVFIVAHRLSTIQQADNIYYMEAGQILEAGTHKELMELDGKYKELFLMHEQANQGGS